MKRLLAVALLLNSLPFAAGEIRWSSEPAKWADFETAGAGRHPWKSSAPLPTSLQEAGLSGELAFCEYMPSYRDGGTCGGFVRDQQGNYFAFAFARPTKMTAGVPEDVFIRPTVFVGAAWCYDKAAVQVPYDSPCEKFVQELLGDRWIEIERWFYLCLADAYNCGVVPSYANADEERKIRALYAKIEPALSAWKKRIFEDSANKRPDGTSAEAPPSNPSQGAAVPHP